MHALIKDNAVKQYPYNIWHLKKDNPNVSFPKTASFPAKETDELLLSFDVHPVISTTPIQVTNTQVLEEGTPVFDEKTNNWTQTWSVRDMTNDEITSHYNNKANEVRAKRNELLTACDWTQVIDAPVDQTAWATYRQALRDLPDQAGFPFDVVYPDAP